MDRIDRRILDLLQEDCTLSVMEVGRRVGLSTTPCWRRIQRLEEEGILLRRVALVSCEKVNARVTAFVTITIRQHDKEDLEHLARTISSFPEVMEFYRMAGQADYMLRVLVPDIQSYDAFYQKLIGKIQAVDISTSFAMEQIKYTTHVPLHYLSLDKEGD